MSQRRIKRRNAAEDLDAKLHQYETSIEGRERQLLQSLAARENPTISDVIIELVGRLHDAKLLANFASFLAQPEQQNLGPELVQWGSFMERFIDEALERTDAAMAAVQRETSGVH